MAAHPWPAREAPYLSASLRVANGADCTAGRPISHAGGRSDLRLSLTAAAPIPAAVSVGLKPGRHGGRTQTRPKGPTQRL